MSISWHAVDLKTGRRGMRLSTRSQGTVSRIIGEPTDLSGLEVLCWDTDANEPVVGWEAATLPGRMMLVACDELDEPVWGGMILRQRSDASIWVAHDLVTLEAYFDRRYVTDHDYTATAQQAIITGLLADNVTPTGVQFTVDAISPAVVDRVYADDEDKTVLSVLQELMGAEGGPEFTVDLEWADEAHTTLSRILRVRDRIGTGATSPIARFEMPGAVVDFEHVLDATSDNLANDVMATSSGEGDTRPTSSHHIATDLIDGGWVKYERRFSPSTSITDTDVLDSHAAAELTIVRDGLAELSLTMSLDADGPRYGIDFHLGDDVTAVLTCPRFPAKIGPDGDMIAGYTKSVRCVGVEIDYDARTLKPRLLEVG